MSTIPTMSTIPSEALAIAVSHCVYGMVTGHHSLETYRARAAACSRTLAWLSPAGPTTTVLLPPPTARIAPCRGLTRRTCTAILTPWVEDLCANVPPWCPLHNASSASASPESLRHVVAVALEWACRRVSASTLLAQAWRQHLHRAAGRGALVGQCVLACVAQLSSTTYPHLAQCVARARGLLALCRSRTAVCRAAVVRTVLGLEGPVVPVDREALPDVCLRATRLIDGAEAARLEAMVAFRDRIVAAVRKYSVRQAVIAECFAEEVSVQVRAGRHAVRQ